MKRLFLLVLIVVLGSLPVVSCASELKAELSAASVAMGQSVQLRIDGGAAGAAVDTSALAPDFRVDQYRQQRVSEVRQGRFESRVHHVLVLTPLRVGALMVPALAVGADQTPALPLTVTGEAARAPTVDDLQADAPYFVQARLDGEHAYVGQSVGLVVSVFLGQNIATGELIQEAPAGISLQRIGDDVAQEVMRDGRRYVQIDRRFVLTPEVQGAISVPPARFEGRLAGGLWQMGQPVQAQGPALVLQVADIPDNAPAPWLPLQGARLRYSEQPAQVVAGQGATFELEARLQGATRAQLDVLPLPSAAPGYRLYPEATTVVESFDADGPVLVLRRRFVLLAEQSGSLLLPAVALPWWDVAQARPQQATSPALMLDVLPSAGGAARQGTEAPSPLVAATVSVDDPSLRGQWLWIVAVGVSGVVLGAWGWSRRARRTVRPVQQPVASEDNTAALERALREGSVQDVIDVLCAWRGVHAVDGLYAQLRDADQRDALQAAEKAWWGADGNRSAARQRLRQAFAQGPHWQAVDVPSSDKLPPLYRQN